jgi:hypothetical protein
VHHHQHEKWEREQQEEYEQQMYGQQTAAQQEGPPMASPQPAGEDDMIKQVKELSSLHESGILTDDEFVAAKAKLFGS